MTTPLRLTALDRSSGITRKPTNACRAGESTICTTPPAKLIATMADQQPAQVDPVGDRPAPGTEQQRRYAARGQDQAQFRR